MAKRHLIRSIVLQTLFEWDFNGYDDSSIDSLFERNLKEFGVGAENLKQFGERLIGKIIDNKEKLDKIIQKAAPQWPIDQISIVDRNILRIGLCELLFFEHREIPPKVAINEAVELAKNFGGSSSGRFVNGVLGTVYRDMGEPQPEPAKELLVGAVVYKEKDGELSFVLVHDIFGYWTLSKGKAGNSEDLPSVLKERIKEEIGIDIDVEGNLGENKYFASEPERGRVEKHVVYFLARALNEDIRLKEKEGLDDARWFKLRELKNLIIYDDIKKILAGAIKKLTAEK